MNLTQKGTFVCDVCLKPGNKTGPVHLRHTGFCQHTHEKGKRLKDQSPAALRAFYDMRLAERKKELEDAEIAERAGR